MAKGDVSVSGHGHVLGAEAQLFRHAHGEHRGRALPELPFAVDEVDLAVLIELQDARGGVEVAVVAVSAHVRRGREAEAPPEPAPVVPAVVILPSAGLHGGVQAVLDPAAPEMPAVDRGVAGPDEIPAPELGRVHVDGLGQGVQEALDREGPLDGPEPAKRSARDVVGVHQGRFVHEVFDPVQVVHPHRRRVKDGGRDGGEGPGVPDDPAVLGREGPVLSDPHPEVDLDGQARASSPELVLPAVQQADRAARLSRERGGQDRTRTRLGEIPRASAR